MRILHLCSAIAMLVTVSGVQAEVTFTEVSEETGLRQVHDPLGLLNGGQNVQNLYGPGVGIEDVNNDGWLDVFFTNGIAAGNKLFLNDGDWSFTDVSEAMYVDLSRVGNGVAFADMQNNGRPDLVVGNFYAQPFFYVNQSARYRERGESLGVVPLLPSGDFFVIDPESMGVSFGDYNQDGFVDLYVANYRYQIDVLYKSLAGGGFAYDDAIEIADPVYGFTGVFTDLDDDNDLDIYVANDFGVNYFFENQGAAGDYGFVERARFLRIQGGNNDVHPKGLSMGLAIADYDNDLDLDIYITNYQLNILFRNDGRDPDTGDLQFTDVANAAGVEFPINCWGVDLVDLDLDTDLDLIHTGGHIYSDNIEQPFDIPDQVFLNDGASEGWTFTSINSSSGFDARQFGRALATGDLDRDGDLDVITTNNTFYNPTPDDPEADLYEGHSMVFRNDQNDGNNWLNLRLEGTFGRGGVSNRSAVGARVYCETTDGITMMREIHAGTSYLSHHSLEVEFGLGQADVASVSVRWPGGDTEEFTGIQSNRFYRLVEGSGRGAPVSIALSSFGAQPLDRGVLIQWVSAPGVRIVDVEVERTRADDPDGWQRRDDVELSLGARGGQVFDRHVVAGVSYLYRLTLRLEGGLQVQSAIAEVRASDRTVPLGRRAAVGQNYPNPFNPSTRIEFSLPRSMRARLVVHDARGRIVRTLYDDLTDAGAIGVDWDGRDDTGAEVASGVYLYSLITEDGTSARRMVLTR